MYCINISHIMIVHHFGPQFGPPVTHGIELARAFTFSTGLAKNSQQGLVDWLSLWRVIDWRGITWKAWPLIKREGNLGWAAKWFVLSIHVPVSLHYRMALTSSSTQHSTEVFVTSCCTHCFLSWLKSIYFTFPIPFPTQTEMYVWRGNSHRGACG